MGSRQSLPRSIPVALRREQYRSTVWSILVSLVLVSVLLAVLAVTSLQTGDTSLSLLKVSMTREAEDLEKEEIRKSKASIAGAPSAPSASVLSRVIASKAPTASAMPIPEFLSDSTSSQSGLVDGLGDGAGWEVNVANQVIKERPDLAANPDLNLSRDGSVFFYGQTINAGRVVFVIERGHLMCGALDRWHDLMEQEFPRVIQRLKGDQMLIGAVFFAGAAHSIGDSISLQMTEDFNPTLTTLYWNFTKGAVVQAQDESEYHWNKNPSNRISWKPTGRKQVIPWYRVTPATKSWFLKVASLMTDGRPLHTVLYDSIWSNPLNMALDMSPPPEEIIFAVSGASPGSGAPGIWVDQIGQRARKMGVKINCFNIRSPDIESPLRRLSRMTSGQYTLVDFKLISAANKNQSKK